MTLTSKFYTGPVNNVQWAEGIRRASVNRYMVAGSPDSLNFLVGINAGVTRGFSINAGTAAGGGILDVNDATIIGAPYALPFNATDRWWLIGLRRVWGATKATSVDWIAGTASKAIPTRPSTPGVEDFHPLALAFVPAGGGAITILADLRVLAGNAGHLVGFDDLVLGFMDEVGTRILIAKDGTTTGTIENIRTLNPTTLVPEWVSRNLRISVESGATAVTGVANWQPQAACNVARGGEDGKDRTVHLVIRRSGASFNFGAAGAAPSTLVTCTMKAGDRPAADTAASALVYTTAGNRYAAGVVISPAGSVLLESGPAGGEVSNGGPGDPNTLLVDVRYRVP